MAKITFVILAHENADHIADLARNLTEWNDTAHAVIHYDLKSPAHEFEKLKAAFANSARVHIVTERIKCGWGDFSLVDATVRALKLIRKSKIDCERVMLVSGACMPIRPLAELSQFLDQHPRTEFIESFDSSWITGGLRQERWQYWHFFNYQTQHGLFQAHYNAQRKVWPKRRFPRGLEPRYGSQWWCLTWSLCEKILDYIAKHPLVYFFFSTTWIPDEMFFQTMAFRFTPNIDLASRTLTFFHFNDWGKPLVFLDDHIGMFKDLPFFFARKISGRATKLRADLTAIAKMPAPEQPLQIDLKQRYSFPFKALLAAKRPPGPVAPALFQFRDKTGWVDALDTCAKSFVVLYGPPQLTRRAADVLAQSAELTVFGRLFRPGIIDFGAGRHSFNGLQSNDYAIRDYDTPGYFRRILNRCDTLPVLELCPGDDPAAEATLLQSRNAIVVPIVPGDDSDLMRQVYWILSTNPDAQAAVTADPGMEDAPILVFRSMNKAVERRISPVYAERIETFKRAATAAHCASPELWAQSLQLQHGNCIRPLVEAYDGMNDAVRAASLVETVADMPEAWRQSLLSLASLDPDWRVIRLNFPLALPEIWTPALQLRDLALALSKPEQALALMKAEEGSAQ